MNAGQVRGVRERHEHAARLVLVDPARLTSIRFLFGRKPSGMVLLDKSDPDPDEEDQLNTKTIALLGLKAIALISTAIVLFPAIILLIIVGGVLAGLPALLVGGWLA
jgi:hypothetical protein